MTVWNNLTIFKNVRLLLSVFALNLVTLSTGITFAWPSPSMPVLERHSSDNPLDEPISSQTSSWLASINLLTATLGTIAPMVMIKPLGRKRTILILALPVAIAHILFSSTSNLIVYFIARGLAGLTLGATFQMVPMYVAEISEVSNRGAMGCCFSVFIAIGHLITYGIGPFVSFRIFNILSAIPPIAFIFLVFIFVEESPYDFVARGNYETAEKILRVLRLRASEQEIRNELDEINRTIKTAEVQLKIGDFVSSKPLRKSLLICVTLALLQQFSGINAVISSMGPIFKSVGDVISPEMSSIYVAIVQLIATFVTPILIDRSGRKNLLSTSMFFIFIALAGLGTYFYLSNNGYDTDSIFWLPLLSLIIFIIFFNTSLGSVLYVIMGEIFPTNAKNVSSTVTTFSLTLSSFILTWLYLYSMSELGNEYTFWFASSVTALGFVFVLLTVPETKGKTFFEIQEILK